MIALDPRSVTFLAGLLGVAMGLILLGVWRGFPAAIQGLRQWTLAPLLCFASALLFSLDRHLPTAVVVVVANGLLLAGYAAFYFGSQCFYGVRPSYARWAALILVALVLLLVFVLVWPDFRLRVSVLAAAVTALQVAHLRLLLAQPASFASRFMAAVVGGLAVITTVRVATAWMQSPDASRFDPSPVQVAVIVGFSVAILLLSVGALLLASERVRQMFERLAMYDPLTGALTRRALMSACEAEMERSRRYRHPLSVLMLDVDHFKQVNDSLGHLAGDQALAAFAARVQSVLRKPDSLGRYGGEEFVVLLPETHLDEARRVAERVREALAGRIEMPRLTASIGVAECGPQDLTLDTLLSRADAALYRAKAQGRDRVEVDE